MQIINSDKIKEKLINSIGSESNKKILILSQSEEKQVLSYKQSIIKRCKEFNISYEDKNFSQNENHEDILAFTKKNENVDGFILLLPVSKNTDLSYLRKNINLRDLDGFTYESLGKMMDKDFSYLPQTAKSVIMFLEYMNVNFEGKDIIIANSNNVIGKPLAMYLNAKKATVTLFNSKTNNQREKIKNCDIFISAIGKACYYDKSYFRDGQIIIDVGISLLDGKLKGDIDIDSLAELDVSLVSSKKGVGSITTLSLINTLVNQ